MINCPMQLTEVQNKLQKDFDPDYTIVVTNPPVINGSLTNLATGLIMIVNAMRTSQCQGRKGVLICLFVYLGFYVAFNTVQVISRRVVGRAEETST